MSDPNSFANTDDFVCTKINWHVEVNFKDSVLQCSVKLNFNVKHSEAKKLVSVAIANMALHISSSCLHFVWFQGNCYNKRNENKFKMFIDDEVFRKHLYQKNHL